MSIEPPKDGGRVKEPSPQNLRGDPRSREEKTPLHAASSENLRVAHNIFSILSSSDSWEDLSARAPSLLTSSFESLSAGIFFRDPIYPEFHWNSPGPTRPSVSESALAPYMAHLAAGETMILSDPKDAEPFKPVGLPFVASPILGGGRLIGLLVASGFATKEPSEESLLTLSLLSRMLSRFWEENRRKEELSRRIKDMGVLREVAEVLSGSPDLAKILRRMVEIIVKALRVDVCAFLLYDEKTQELVTQPGAHGLPETGEEPVMYRIHILHPRTSSGRAFLSGKPYLSPDVLNDPHVHPRVARLWNVRSLIVAPLILENKSIGVLRMGCREPGAMTEDHLRLATMIADQAAIIVQNASLYAQVRGSVHRLDHLNRLKNEFISMVSHDIKSPLTSVKGFLDVVLSLDTGPLTPRQEKCLHSANDAVDRMMVLMEDLLDISRIEAGKIKIHVVNISPAELLWQSARDMEFKSKERRLVLEMDVPSNLPKIKADPHRLRQVMDNLLGNAVKFTPDGGRIVVAAREKGENIWISVRDSGVGVPPEDREKIFDRFYQTKVLPLRKSGGAGLGLAICKSLIELHGGTIRVESPAGGGSDFQFTLPLRYDFPPSDTPPK